MALKEILSDTLDGGLPPVPKFRKPHVRKARMELAARFTEADALPPIVELEDVAKRLERATESETLDQISRRDWAKASWCLWLKNHMLAKNGEFLRAYLDRVFQANRRSLYKKLISAYLRDYRSKQENIVKVGDFLVHGIQKWDWVWAERQRRFELFGPAGPGNVARSFLESDVAVETFLEDTGLGGDLGFRGFAVAAYVRSLLALKKMKGDQFDKVLPRVLRWSADQDGLRYPGTEGALADALLLRWHDKTPTKKTQRKIEEFVLTHFKDPRIPSVIGSKWSHVSDDAKSVILRWLVGAALEQFLQVVDQVAMLSQWRYRRAFWTAYYKAGLIDEAWVAFAWKGQIAAKRSFGEMKGFAKLDGIGVSPDHAVLVMKIAGLTIADWNHNGKCHIWTESNKSAPKLYRRVYDRNSLVRGSSNKGVIHGHAPRGTWQAKVASYIARHTGIRLGMNDYMPKRRR